ncbi:BTAD domain-containing putative transcriptional regulator [Actinomadura flavalba]|uniref:BTAD domain-containing putative transcriptional regulator n=1 Tax=Actinomadura flavalba TaxID=1120938 RepID=UPI0003810CAC|nr:BTAD domain-containing putative transcriptional regulator [Actinomadura flavalba]
MRFGVLGPVTAWTDAGVPVPVPGRQVRALLADLLAHDGASVPADRLIDDLWGDAPPANPPAALSVKVSQLRRALEDAEPGARALVESTPGGYALRLGTGGSDAREFHALLAEGGADALGRALALWRGPAFADVADAPFARAAAAHLAELRITAVEDCAQARLERGEHAALAAALAADVAAHPLRERLVGLHLRALYGAGRQSEALAAYERLRAALADELGLDPGPELVALHRAILTQDPALSAPATGNLPVHPTPLIGRDAALTDVRALLETDRLVTLAGPGGVGKTRLALAAAGAVPGEVWFVELAALDRGADVAEAITAVLGLHDRADPPPPDRLVTALRGRRALLVLDNCEHVLDEVAGVVVRLLAGAPGVRVLATGREPLDVPGETVWSVPPLDVPPPGADAAALAASGAVALFNERARAADRSFAVTPDVAVLCRRLDGIPLALELAATRVRALGTAGLVARLDDRFRLLATGHRGAPPRHRTLHAMIDWSWELLDEPDRAVLARLAVFADGCTPEAAGQVCDGDVLDALVRLVDRSLVTRADGPRYRLLESVAAYALTRLDPAAEAAARARHAAYYAGLAERTELRGPAQLDGLDLLDAEAANLRAASDAAVRAGDAATALRLALALAWYRLLRGRWTEARRTLAAALALPGGPAADRAAAVAWATGYAGLQGDTADWAARRDAALDGLAAVTDPVARARAHWFVRYGGSEADAAGTGAALGPLTAECAAAGDDWSTAATLLLASLHAHAHADADALERAAQRAVHLFTRLGDRWGRVNAGQWLAAHAELTGDLGRAARLQRDVLRLAGELRLGADAAAGEGWLGWICYQRADFAAARAAFARAAGHGAEQGDESARVLGELGLGLTGHRLGDLDAAETRLSDLLAGIPEDGAPPLYLPLVLVGLGQIAATRGETSRAVRLHTRALDAGRALDAPRDVAFAVEGLAAAVHGAGDSRRAARLLGAATETRVRAGLPRAPVERQDADRLTEDLRAALGDDALAAELAAGAKEDVP